MANHFPISGWSSWPTIRENNYVNSQDHADIISGCIMTWIISIVANCNGKCIM